MDNFFDMNNMKIEEDFEMNNIKYHVEINSAAIFKAKLTQFLRMGLIFENFTVPKKYGSLPEFRGVKTNDTKYYSLYVSVPKTSYVENYSPAKLEHDFQKWITRFIFHDLDEEKYQILKNNNALDFRVLSKMRDENWTEKKGNELVKSYQFTWALTENMGADVVNKLDDMLNSYKEYFDNLPQDKKDELNHQLDELLENLDDTDLNDLFN